MELSGAPLSTAPRDTERVLDLSRAAARRLKIAALNRRESAALSLQRGSRQSQLRGKADALQLAGRAFGDFGEKHDFARGLERREAFGEERAQLLITCRHTVAQDDRRGDVFAQHVMRNRERNRLQDRGVIHQRLVNLARRDFLAAAIDDLLQPPRQGEVALRIDDALIAGAEPSVDEGLRIRLRVVLIAAGHAVAANDHLAGLAAPEQPALVVHDLDLQTGGEADRARLAHTRRGLAAIWCVASVIP